MKVYAFHQVKDSRIALAGLSAEYFGNPAKELITIGITGTKGKTTTTYMIRSVLEAVYAALYACILQVFKQIIQFH